MAQLEIDLDEDTDLDDDQSGGMGLSQSDALQSEEEEDNDGEYFDLLDILDGRARMEGEGTEKAEVTEHITPRASTAEPNVHAQRDDGEEIHAVGEEETSTEETESESDSEEEENLSISGSEDG